MILSLFRKDPPHETASALYHAAHEKARDPAFYLVFGVEDSPEGRFELLSLHVYLLIARLKFAPGAGKLAQQIADCFFANLDDSLREMGVGDLSVGKKIRAMAEGFYGRVGVYDAALQDAAPTADLADAIARNVFGEREHPRAPALADYVRRARTALAGQPDARLMSGIIVFPDAAAAA